MGEAARRVTSVCIALSMIAGLAVPARGAEPRRQSDTLRFGIVTFYNPRLMILRYQPLLDLLAERTGRPVELALARNYRETVDQLQRGDVDLAYLGPVTYVRARHRFGARPLVRLNTRDRDTFTAVIAVREDSPIRSLEELRGAHFAFGSPLSTSSHLYPRKMLRDAGIRPGDLGGYAYYRHHDSAARAVLTGDADACGIRDIVALRYEDRGLRVIARSEPIPNFPLVVAPGADRALVDSLRSVLLGLDPHSESDSLLMADWDVELQAGFREATAADYDRVESLMVEIFGAAAYEGDPSLPGAVEPGEMHRDPGP